MHKSKSPPVMAAQVAQKKPILSWTARSLAGSWKPTSLSLPARQCRW